MHDGLDERAAVARAPAVRSRSTSPKTVASSPTSSAAISDAVRAVDLAARVVLQHVEHDSMPMIASRASSASPTPVRRGAGIARSSRSVSGGSPVGTRPRLLDADEIRVQRLTAVVELDLHMRDAPAPGAR